MTTTHEPTDALQAARDAMQNIEDATLKYDDAYTRSLSDRELRRAVTYAAIAQAESLAQIARSLEIIRESLWSQQP